MPWVDVDEPYAKPPRVREIDPPNNWDGVVDLDEGFGELIDVTVTRDFNCDLTGCVELTVTDSTLDGVVFTDPGTVLEARRSQLNGCDLSQAIVRSVVSSRIEGCKLTGSELSGASLQDVVFDRCHFRHANLRMAKLRRVRFVDCSFDDVDCFELNAEDVEFTGSTLERVNVDRLQASRVDLREAKTLGLSGVGSLTGCLIAEHQIPALAYSLVFSVGVGVEQPEAHPTNQ